MRQVIAIGGGGFGRTQKSHLIEQYILDQSSQEKPNICFIPTATGDLDPYVVNFYTVFSKLNCNPSHISFFKRTIDLEEHILNQDVIFVGGGNTKSMLAVWKDWGLDLILKKAYDQGAVMSGVSAGAICWFEQGLTDSWASELKMMPCMNFISGNCAPHYDEEPQRRPATKKLLQDNAISFMYGIEGGAALHFINEQPEKTVRFQKNKHSYNVTLKDSTVSEKPYPIKELEQ
ncbi:MAG: peptidase E [Gammaproteobacteria bacterium]|jgi:aminopeptidase N|nr:peptidase E [Gammaproteobacteria bacterium]MDB4042975.1 peptidase E [Gammaproteobacteria bacterium]